jgi:hypothetical protein
MQIHEFTQCHLDSPCISAMSLHVLCSCGVTLFPFPLGHFSSRTAFSCWVLALVIEAQEAVFSMAVPSWCPGGCILYSCSQLVQRSEAQSCCTSAWYRTGYQPFWPGQSFSGPLTMCYPNPSQVCLWPLWPSASQAIFWIDKPTLASEFHSDWIDNVFDEWKAM